MQFTRRYPGDLEQLLSPDQQEQLGRVRDSLRANFEHQEGAVRLQEDGSVTTAGTERTKP